MKKRLLACFAALLLCPLLALAQQVTADSTPAPDPFPMAQTARSQMVRVYLRRLNIASRLDLTLAGQYTLAFGGQSLAFERGSELTFLLRDGQMLLWYRGMSLAIGTEAALQRHAPSDGGENGLRLTGQEALYAGDLRLEVKADVIRPILTIDVEDYLLGVVPYEMSDSFPIEALKAQAVAARTYALRRADGQGDYDVDDTTNDQVFRGYTPGKPNAEAAVYDTRGLCAFYKGEIAECYYTASNGGQTELPSHVWQSNSADPYCAMTDDPYDVENPASPVRSLLIPKTADKPEDTPYALRTLLADQLANTLRSRGYDTDPQSLRVDEVTAVSLDTPMFPEPSRLMTRLTITFRYSARTRVDPIALNTPAPDDEVSLFTVAPTSQSTPSPEAARTPAPAPTPVPTPRYGAFEPAAEPVTLQIPVFPTAEGALAFNINSYDNELWTVAESADGFALQARRYGHGAGLSQRGAEWMALRHGKSFTDIIAFYYPGVELRRYDPSRPALPTVAPELLETPGPAPTATPRPTLMPITVPLPEGAWYAAVTEIDQDSSLNLRAEPSMDAEIVRRLYWGQRLIVLETCPQEGWVKVMTDAAEGCVMEKYLTKEQ